MPRTKAAGVPRPRRAAQYLRMSTDMQKYSIENQAAAVAAYAARRAIRIVKTYTDRGKSGVSIAGRDGLKNLISDAQNGRADFDCILVYDISRWGRFQDVDESAYYEFICRRAGIPIHYCADEFENDGSLSSIVLKNIKRVAAADYSRQLSKRVFIGQSHIATLGYWRGGPAPYGLRRVLLDESGKRKAILQTGDRKNLKTERTTLAPGPKREVETVRTIFQLFASRKKNRTDIAAWLNAKGVPNARGEPWTMLTISNVLKNEAYLGNIVFNRRSQKVGETAVRNPPDMWIRHENAFPGILTKALFDRAQKVMAELESGRTRTDKELLDRLRVLYRREGRLTMKLIMTSRDVPNCSVYTKRFGSLTRAYELVGYKQSARYRFQEIFSSIDRTICSAAAAVCARLEELGKHTSFLPELYLLTLNRSTTVSIAVARSIRNGITHRAIGRWEIRRIRFRRSDLTLVIRMNSANTTIKDYFLLPSLSLPKPMKDSRTRLSDRHFSEFRYRSLDEVVSALNDRLSNRRPRRSINDSAAAGAG